MSLLFSPPFSFSRSMSLFFSRCFDLSLACDLPLAWRGSSVCSGSFIFLYGCDAGAAGGAAAGAAGLGATGAGLGTIGAAVAGLSAGLRASGTGTAGFFPTDLGTPNSNTAGSFDVSLGGATGARAAAGFFSVSLAVSKGDLTAGLGFAGAVPEGPAASASSSFDCPAPVQSSGCCSGTWPGTALVLRAQAFSFLSFSFSAGTLFALAFAAFSAAVVLSYANIRNLGR